MPEVLIDSYYDATPDSELAILSPYPTAAGVNQARGQTFKPRDFFRISKCKFELKKVGLPTGLMRTRLYAMNAGMFGNGGKPSFDEYPTITTPLATSNAVDISTLTTAYQWIEFAFPSNQRYLLTAFKPYCLAYMPDLDATVDGENYIVHAGSLGNIHEGNCFLYNAFPPTRWGGYTIPETKDRNFMVYGLGKLDKAKLDKAKLDK